jgi:hypothetical protein
MDGMNHEIMYGYPIDLKKNLRYIVTYNKYEGGRMSEEMRKLVKKKYRKSKIIDVKVINQVQREK